MVFHTQFRKKSWASSIPRINFGLESKLEKKHSDNVTNMF